jgi:hypothetical protein
MTSARASTTVWVRYFDDSREVDGKVFFLVLKTGEDLRITAALVRPTKLLDLDA